MLTTDFQYNFARLQIYKGNAMDQKKKGGVGGGGGRNFQLIKLCENSTVWITLYLLNTICIYKYKFS